MIFCLGFVSKKLGEKTLFDSLFTCTFARARATRKKERETERKKERETRNKKQRSRTARSFLFWGAILFPFCARRVGHPRSSARALVRLSFLPSFFLHPRGKKNVFQEQKKVKNTSERESERDRAPKKKKKKKKRDITIAFSLALGCCCFLFSVRGCRRRRLRREESAGSQRKKKKKKTDFRWTERERKKVSFD